MNFIFLSDTWLAEKYVLADIEKMLEVILESNGYYIKDLGEKSGVAIDKDHNVGIIFTFNASRSGMSLDKWLTVLGGISCFSLADSLSQEAMRIAGSLIPSVNNHLNNDIYPQGGWEAPQGSGHANPNNVKIAQGQQDKHIVGTNNYKQGIANGKNPSILKENPQQLLDDFVGMGQKIPNTNKERVNFGKVIGQYYDDITGTYMDTTNGIIHYDSKGMAHIVPARP